MNPDHTIAAEGHESMADYFDRTKGEKERSLRGLGHTVERVDWNDPLSYVREMYGVPARVGGRVLFQGRVGEIVGGDGQYVLVDVGGIEPLRCHPTWQMEYVDAA